MVFKKPLVTVSCHEDMTAADLVGRYLLNNDGTFCMMGPHNRCRNGAICYLDEVVEARQDTTVAIHRLLTTDVFCLLKRKVNFEKLMTIFTSLYLITLAIKVLQKDLKGLPSRDFALDFEYPANEVETNIVCSEADVELEIASSL